MPFLNDKIIAYLTVNNISYSSGDYQTGQPEGQPDQILEWNTAKLGAEPTQTQLDAALPIYEGQQIAAQNNQQATLLLQQTDWTQVTDVPLLNKQEFTDYRMAVRAITINPPLTPATFPELPVEQWS